ncbi:hypothetical protein LINPERHAP1_LOCUS25371 [Linum perenne]
MPTLDLPRRRVPADRPALLLHDLRVHRHEQGSREGIVESRV